MPREHSAREVSGVVNRFFLIAIGLSLCIPVLALAQADRQGPDPAPRYRVEMVIFTQPPVGEQVEELPQTERPPRSGTLAWPLRRDASGQLGYPRLDPGEHRLATAARRLAEAAGYRVHWHAAWEQPGLPADAAQAVAIRPGGSAPSGTVRLYRSRYLHFEVSLAQRLADGGAEARYWVLEASRRMRSGETHYIDHPALGVIVRVDPLTAAE